MLNQMLRWLCTSLFALAAVACATSPEGRKQLRLVPEAQLTAMGQQTFEEMKATQPINKDPKINAYVTCVSDALTAQAADGNVPEKWEVVVFQDPSANAFALPGGKIGVHTGLLEVAQTTGQLAAVIGHEIGHVIADHGNERVSETLAAQGGLALVGAFLSGRLEAPKRDLVIGALGIGAQFGVLMPHSRDQETESDIIGLRLMARAGFNPEESIALWQNMAAAGGGQPPEFLSTHPSHGTRMETLRTYIPEVQSEATGRQPASTPDCPKP